MSASIHLSLFIKEYDLPKKSWNGAFVLIIEDQSEPTLSIVKPVCEYLLFVENSCP